MPFCYNTLMDSAWAHRRRTRTTFIISAVGFIALAVYITVNMYTPPSCYDRKMNQDERGVDCGGSCALLCPFQVEPPQLLWARAFEVSPGTWAALAYLDNPNFNAQAPYAPFRFKSPSSGTGPSRGMTRKEPIK